MHTTAVIDSGITSTADPLNRAGDTPQAAAAGDDEGSPGRVLPVEDLTAAVRSGAVPAAVVESSPNGGNVYLRLARVLCRQAQNHVLLIGDRGVGKTALLRELARRAWSGEVPFLKERRFVRVDCSLIPPDDSTAILEALFSQLAGNSRLILCLDGLAALLRKPHGGTNVAELTAALHRSSVPMMGVLSRWEYNDLLAGQADLRELCTRIELPEFQTTWPRVFSPSTPQVLQRLME